MSGTSSQVSNNEAETSETGHTISEVNFFGYCLKMTFFKILSLLIGVISPVRELGGSFQSQSVLCSLLKESGSRYGQEMDWWRNGGRQARIKAL